MKRRGFFGGSIVEHKEMERNGVAVGIVEGYLATWDVDRGNDQFMPGCFTEAIADLKARNRPLRLKDQHRRTVGGYPAEMLVQDERGLKVTGEINLELEQGRDMWALIKQGVLSDMSVGWSITREDYTVEDGIRKISKSGLWEGSIVDEPMNQNAVITGYKAMDQAEKLPEDIAEKATEWDAAGAEKRWREKSGSEEFPSDVYRNGFLWVDDETADEFGAYKLQVVDVIDGDVKLVPRAVFAARAAIAGAKGGVDVPDEDHKELESLIDTLYERMSMDAPFSGDSKGVLSIDEFDGLSKSNLGYMLKSHRLSKATINHVLKLRDPADGGVADDSMAGVKSKLDELIDILHGGNP